MAISRAQLAKELEPGLNALFGMSYDSYDREYEEIFAMEDSQRAFEEEVLITGFGSAPVKTEGQGVVFDNASESFSARYTHDTIALAFALTDEAVEDNEGTCTWDRQHLELHRIAYGVELLEHGWQVNSSYDESSGDRIDLTGIVAANAKALGNAMAALDDVLAPQSCAPSVRNMDESGWVDFTPHSSVR